MDWQPIDTAPKEKYVFTWCGNGAAILVLTLCYGRTIQSPDSRINEHRYEWRDDSGDGGQDWRPTHWAPIVPPSKD